jgi:hypothetical protein
MGNAANQNGGNRHGGESQGVGRIDSTSQQQVQQMALHVVSCKEVGEGSRSPADSCQEGDGHKEQPRPEHNKGFLGMLHVEELQHEWHAGVSGQK